jgi:hypothetical protein
LTPAQAALINQLVSDWAASLHSRVSQADEIRSQIKTETDKDQPDAAAIGGFYLRLQSICRQATTARNEVGERTRAVLSRDQMARLQLLDDALQAMPRVIEAQRAMLLPDSVDTAPVGLPVGQVTVSTAFVPSTPSPLPGCLPVVQAQPGTIPVIGGRLRR